MSERGPAGHTEATADRHLVLVGVNFTPRRATGDKNFWVALLPLLAADVDRITVLSIRSEAEPRERLRIGDCDVEIRYIPPAAESTAGRTRLGRRVLGWTGGSHPRIQGLISKQLVTRRLMAEVGEVLRDGRPAQVHLMDNFGPANHLLAWAARRRGARVSVTAIAYERRGRRSYHAFLRSSYRVRGLTVVTMSTALRARLRSLGVRSGALVRIPWGVTPPDVPSPEERRAARARLGLPMDGPVVLWAGFIQQVREPDFHLALRIASTARDDGVAATFIFAFKPETFRAEYATLHRPGSGIHVMPTPVDRFTDARAAADIFLSPIDARDCIVAPPLTWIECMSTGIPVLTTDVAGAEELVEDGRTGYRARDDRALLAGLRSLVEDHRSMREACRAKVVAAYNLVDIERAYVALWFGVNG